MKSFLIPQINLIFSGHKLHNKKVDILIEKGKIKEVSKGGSIKAKGLEAIEFPNACISPGWFDMQVHLSDPGFEYKESFKDLNDAAIKGGFTGLLCYPNTEPVVDNGQILRSLIQQSQHFPVDFFFSGALSHGTEGKDLAEVYEMHEAGAKAFTDGTHPVQNPGLLLRAFQYTKAFSGLIIDCPMDLLLNGGGQMHEGAVSTSLGMKGIPLLSESLALSRQLQILEYAAARLHVQPISSSESVALMQAAKRKKLQVSVGTNIAYLSMTDKMLEEFDSNYKLFPPLRSEKSLKQLQKALEKGQIDVISSGHQAQGTEEKNLQFEQAEPGMLSLQTFFSQANEHLIQKGIIDLDKWVSMLAIKPREILGLDIPALEEGAVPNLTIFDPEKSWTFDASQISSRAKNSPHLNKKQIGKVLGLCKDGDFFDMR
ncbi:MAG: dihydroorotase [Bacteroidota bacterium]